MTESHDATLREIAALLACTAACGVMVILWLAPAMIPHAVEVDITDRVMYGLYWREGMAPRANFIVVSVSQFAGARGCTSGKIISLIVTCACVGGVLGSLRWNHLLGDESSWSSFLLVGGFLGILCVPLFEINSEKVEYVKDKLRFLSDLLELEVVLSKDKQQALKLWYPGSTEKALAKFLLEDPWGQKISEAIFTTEQVEDYPYTAVLKKIQAGEKCTSLHIVASRSNPDSLFVYPSFWDAIHNTGAFTFILGPPIAITLRSPTTLNIAILAVHLAFTVLFVMLLGVLPSFPGLRMSWVPGCSVLSETWMKMKEKMGAVKNLSDDPDWPPIYRKLEEKEWGRELAPGFAELAKMFEAAYTNDMVTHRIDRHQAQTLIDQRLKQMTGLTRLTLEWMDKAPYSYRRTVTFLHVGSELVIIAIPCIMAAIAWWTFNPN